MITVLKLFQQGVLKLDGNMSVAFSKELYLSTKPELSKLRLEAFEQYRNLRWKIIVAILPDIPNDLFQVIELTEIILAIA